MRSETLIALEFVKHLRTEVRWKQMLHRSQVHWYVQIHSYPLKTCLECRISYVGLYSSWKPFDSMQILNKHNRDKKASMLLTALRVVATFDIAASASSSSSGITSFLISTLN